jgi:hypothetical protein
MSKENNIATGEKFTQADREKIQKTNSLHTYFIKELHTIVNSKKSDVILRMWLHLVC